MNPIFQTKFGGKDAPLGEQGNCVQACVASLLEIPLDEAFDSRPYSDEIWFDEFNKWLGRRGLYCIAFDHSVEKPLMCTQIMGYAIMDCMSVSLYQGEHHVVIIKNQEVVHDPNIYAEGRLGDCKGFFLILPFSPAKIRSFECPSN